MTTDQARAAKVHTLKCWPQFFVEVVTGGKPFEIRLNDRDFRAGDVLVLQEWNPDTQQYTGEMVSRTITFITDWEQKTGYVVMGLKDEAALRAARGEAIESACAAVCGLCAIPQYWSVAFQEHDELRSWWHKDKESGTLGWCDAGRIRNKAAALDAQGKEG